MEVTTDDVHDSKVLPNLIANASRHRAIIKAFMDGAYDSSKNYALLRGMNIKSIIKPRRNARVDRGPPERRNSVMILKTLGEKAWGRMVNYGRAGLLRQHSQRLNAYMENIAWLEAWKT